MSIAHDLDEAAPENRRRARRALSYADAVPWSGPGGAGLVGRAGEMALLRGAFDDVAAGWGRVAVVCGEAIGNDGFVTFFF